MALLFGTFEQYSENHASEHYSRKYYLPMVSNETCFFIFALHTFHANLKSPTSEEFLL